MKTITFKVTNLECTSCAMSIDFDLEDLEGVVEASTNYAKQCTTVTFDPKVVDQKTIIARLKQLNYDVKII
ncbi:MAG TPA: hypothetical protein DCG34_11080 [Clostridiales bacterium]|jgi:Cu+-exporting ATPase|nr:hypothetical protein [Clostridiales bacterium]